MTDRELLELAAKAAGITYRIDWKNGAFIVNDVQWDPLEDEGDALRLAVKLRLEIDIHHTGIAVRTPSGYKILLDAEDCNDAYAATRQAIVRAAAGIGKELK
jgi:hypothetical protein